VNNLKYVMQEWSSYY